MDLNNNPRENLPIGEPKQNMNLLFKRAFLPIIIVVSLTIGFFGGVFYKKSQEPVSILRNLINTGLGQPSDLDFSLFWDVWEVLHSRYVDKNQLNTVELLYGAINGLVNSVGDPYTVFLEPKQSEDFAREIGGTFGGNGVEIGIREDILTVIAPLPDSPAEQAGLLAGDKIIKIGEETTENITLDKAVNLIRGPNGTQVTLTIVRKNVGEPKDYSVTRGEIKIPTIKWEMVGGDTAHIKLFIFNKNTDSDFEKMADEIVKSDAKKIILDLRNNPGGLLDSAVNIAGYFLSPDEVVLREKFADGTENMFRTSGSAKLKGYPLIILINGGSASASEIVAGALRDNRGATIVGEKSFGKGSVQQIEELKDKSAVKVTIARWFTPNNVSIDKDGIVPNVEVERTEQDINEDKDPQLDKAVEIIKNL